jgi:hypothetical protein
VFCVTSGTGHSVQAGGLQIDRGSSVREVGLLLAETARVRWVLSYAPADVRSLCVQVGGLW